MRIQFTMQATHSTLARLFLIPCLALSSCKETEILKKEGSAATHQVKILQEEAKSMEAQMVDLRKLLPATIASEPQIKQFSAKLATEIIGLENEITRVQTSLVQAETLLAKAQKDLETLRGLAK